MARLYSDSFFHYTKEYRSLELIIKQGFKVSLAEEQFVRSSDDFLYIDIPMVSFCDIPLMMIDMVAYGNLGIGMSRTWGNQNNLQSVHYFTNSKETNSNILERLLADRFFSGERSVTLLRQLSSLKPMNKYRDINSTYGSFTIKNKNGDDELKYYRKDNYIEREWRKVFLRRWNDEDYYTNHPVYLKFHSKEVSFIIVNSFEEKESLIKYIMGLNTIGGYRCSDEDRLSLATNILVMKSIKKNY